MNRLAITALVAVAILALAILAGYVGYRVGDQTGYERAVVAAIAEERWRESEEESMMVPVWNLAATGYINEAFKEGWRVKGAYPLMEYNYDGLPNYQAQVFHLVKSR